MSNALRCRGCRNTISPAQLRRAHIVYDSDGSIEAVYCLRCWRDEKKKRKLTGPMAGGRYHDDAPGAHDVERVTSDDLEERPTRFDDWRGPVELSVDELVKEA